MNHPPYVRDIFEKLKNGYHISPEDDVIYAALNGERENGVVPGRAADDPLDLARADRDADRVLECAVNHGRDLPGAARTARLVLTARVTHLGGDSNIGLHLHFSLRGRSPVRPFRADVGSRAR